MKLQKYIKEIFITVLVISLTAIGYAALSSVSTGDTLTATTWNNLKDVVNSSESKLTNITSVGGNVGIGVTNPTSKLSVFKPIILKDFSVAESHIYLRGGDNGYGLSLGVHNASTSGFLQTKLNDASSSVIPLLLNPEGGSVGIGTTSPIGKLHVNGILILENSAAPTDEKKWAFVTDSNGTIYLQGRSDSGVGGGNMVSFTRGTGPQISQTQFLSSGVPFMVIDHYTTKIGIGTSTPTSKLQVVGLPEYADNVAAIEAGLTIGAFYRTGDLLKVVH